MSKIPPTPGPIPGGGVILGQPRPQMPQRSKYTTEFHGCAIGLYCILDEEGICRGYKVQIFDPAFNHWYDFDFLDDVMDEWRQAIPQMPKVGEKAEGGEQVGGLDGGN